MSLHKSMTHPHTVDGGDSLYIRRVHANILNIQNCIIRVLCFVFLTKYYWGTQIKEDGTGMACGTYVGDDKHMHGFSR